MKIEFEAVENGLLILLNDGEFYVNWVWLIVTIYFVVFFPTWRLVAQYSLVNQKDFGELVVVGFVAAMLWPGILIVGFVILIVRYTIFLGYPGARKEQP